jgi:hypothetical protein
MDNRAPSASESSYLLEDSMQHLLDLAFYSKQSFKEIRLKNYDSRFHLQELVCLHQLREELRQVAHSCWLLWDLVF